MFTHNAQKGKFKQTSLLIYKSRHQWLSLENLDTVDIGRWAVEVCSRVRFRVETICLLWGKSRDFNLPLRRWFPAIVDGDNTCDGVV